MRTHVENQQLAVTLKENIASADKAVGMRRGRNYGIDFLRLFSMFYVVVLHTLRQGGVSDALEVGSTGYAVNWFLQISAYCAVDIFAIISGYVSYSDKERPVKFSGYFNLWFQVVFYGCAIGLVMNVINTDWVTKTDFLKMFFPVSNSLYWYFTAYTGLFFVTPLINAGIRNTDEKILKRIFVFLVVIFSVVEIVTKKQKLDRGYTFAWLLILYIMGGIINKCNIGKRLKVYQGAVLIMLINIAGLLWKLYGTDFSFFGFKINRDTFILYTSPLILAAAVIHVITFSKIKFSKGLVKIIAYAAPFSFAVYLLNTQYYIWNFVLKGTFAAWADKEWYIMALAVVAFSVAFVTGAVLIDRIRMRLFRIAHVDKISLLLEKLLNRMFSK